MRNRASALLVLTLGALLTGASTIGAEILVDVGDEPLEFQPGTIESWAPQEQTSPFHRDRLEDTYTDRIVSGDIAVAAGELISLFGEEDWGENEPRQGQMLNQLRELLSAIGVAQISRGISGALDTVEEQSRFLKTLNAHGFGLDLFPVEWLVDSREADVAGCFSGTADELLFYESTDNEKTRLLLTSEQMRQWRLLRNTLATLIYDQTELLTRANVQALTDAVTRWENFLDRGYSQMPWESLVNGWLIDVDDAPGSGPPTHQWILVHPTVGLELSVDPLDEARVKEAMHAEALGHIWYRGEQLEDYWGLSATVSLREDIDPGLGVLLHIKRNWSLGVTWHDVDEDPFVFMTVDLFGFAKQTAAKYGEEYAKARARLGLD